MSEINRWSTSAAGTVQNAAGYFPEGQAPSTLNDAARTIMAELRRDWQTHNPDVTATFSAQTYSVTYDRNLSSGELSQVFCFIPDSANTGTASLNVNALGAKEIVNSYGNHLPANSITAQVPAVVVYNKSLDKFNLLSGPDNAAAGTYLTGVSSGSTITASSRYVSGAYETGQVFHLIPPDDVNATAPTLNVNGIGAVTIVKNGAEALGLRDIRGGEVISVVYDGTNFQIIGRQPGLQTSQTTTSGTAADYIIPTCCRRITITLNSFSTDGSGNLRVQVGPSTGVVTTGYIGAEGRVVSPSTAAYLATTGSGFESQIGGASRAITGAMTLTSATSGAWMATWSFFNDVGFVTFGAGRINGLVSELTKIRITTTTGDNFDAGGVNVLYE